jgi:N,N'-diacetylchitobiose non-reducing end deacetylase
MARVVLALVPHPDDLEFYAGGTFARLIAEGVCGMIVIATNGSKGSYESEAEPLVRIRRAEAQRAAAVLGAESPLMLGHQDMELEKLAPDVLREQFIRLIRQHKPDVLIAQDPYGLFEPHPDHRAVAWAALEAARYAPLPLVHPEHRQSGLEPHFVTEKYWYANDATHANKIVDVSETIERRLAALAEHASQMTSMVAGTLRQARLAGLDPAAVLGPLAGNPAAAVASALRNQAAEVGARIGVPYGEAFRYERFDPVVEALLAAQAGA